MTGFPPCRDGRPEHNWTLVAHIDGCHWYASHYACEDCGAAYSVRLERSLHDDPYSALWLNLGEGGEPCLRCRELREGAAPAEAEIEFEAAIS